MKTIYVAGASAELDLVRGYIARLRDAGHEITFDWTGEVAQWGSSAAALTEEQRRGLAKKDIDAIMAAEVFWLLVPSAVTQGAWIELGVALTRARLRGVEEVGFVGPVVVSGSDACIFTLLADKRFETHDEALAFLVSQ